jgi:uncharacterized protein (DUF58 family)
MLPRELVAQVKKIEIKTRRTVDELTAGAYHSVFKGRGIEFNEVREYTEDDDVRDIDWNVTARTGIPHIKKYIEERELNVILAVDASASTVYGSSDKTKLARAVEIGALLTFSAIRNHDKVGLLFFTDKNEFFLPPKSGKPHGMRLIRELIARKYDRAKTDIKAALDSLMRLLKKRSVIFLISDLLDEKDFSRTMRSVAKKHDLVVVRILDKMEMSFPKLPDIELEDAESGELMEFLASSFTQIERFSKNADEIHADNRIKCLKANVDLIDLEASEDFVKPLLKFFRMREKKRG